MQAPLHERITALLEPVAAREGFELVAVETAGATKAPVIRVFLDRESGIGIDAIVAANQWISEVLDAEDPVRGSYTLEVSSPGVDRPLVKLTDFERFAGETATLKTKPVEGRSSFTGIIEGVEDETVLLDIEGQTVRVPHAAITKARLKGTVDFEPKGAGD
jgi:ribosome maturation factor RimP